jgi:hypothetical protein
LKTNDVMMTPFCESSLHRACSPHFRQMHGLSMGMGLPYPQMPILPQLLNVMPPLRTPLGPWPPYDVSDRLPENSEGDDDKSLAKERNRIAAQKWRDKKDRYLSDLEVKNDDLRKQAFQLNTQLQLLTVENGLLDNELAFFQSLMAKMMKNSK